MTAERLVAALERGRTAWLLPLIAGALAVGPAFYWSVPDEHGIPFVVAWAVAAIVGAIAVVGVRRRRPSALEVTVVVVAAAVVVGDITLLPSQFLRDLDLYLRAGDAWTAGRPVYLDHLITAVPVDRSLYPFNYPPVSLPLFGALAALPKGVVHLLWPAGSALLAVVALRSFGLAWRWAILALLWRPFAEGLWVGNVAVPLLAAFALAPRPGAPQALRAGELPASRGAGALPASRGAGALLALPGLFKPYAAIPAVWLLRERRWRDVALAAVLVAGLLIATLPLLGPGAWWAWLAGLAWFDASIPALRNFGSGIALAQWISLPIALVLLAATLTLALRARGVEGLWRLGVATPIASPSLFSHGLLTGVPALAGLRPVVLWLAIASTAATPGPVFWVAPGLAIASWLWPALRAARPTGRS